MVGANKCSSPMYEVSPVFGSLSHPIFSCLDIHTGNLWNISFFTWSRITSLSGKRLSCHMAQQHSGHDLPFLSEHIITINDIVSIINSNKAKSVIMFAAKCVGISRVHHRFNQKLDCGSHPQPQIYPPGFPQLP